jgi:hypothetical protein
MPISRRGPASRGQGGNSRRGGTALAARCGRQAMVPDIRLVGIAWAEITEVTEAALTLFDDQCLGEGHQGDFDFVTEKLRAFVR